MSHFVYNTIPAVLCMFEENILIINFCHSAQKSIDFAYWIETKNKTIRYL